MDKRFVYIYFMKRMSDAIREIAPRHVEYWKSRKLDGYMGGPFADRSGGVITFETASIAEAEELAQSDPFVVNGLIDSRWVKEWTPE